MTEGTKKMEPSGSSFIWKRVLCKL